MRTDCKEESREAVKVVKMRGGWQDVVGFWVYSIFKGADQIS